MVRLWKYRRCESPAVKVRMWKSGCESTCFDSSERRHEGFSTNTRSKIQVDTGQFPLSASRSHALMSARSVRYQKACMRSHNVQKIPSLEVVLLHTGRPILLDLLHQSSATHRVALPKWEFQTVLKMFNDDVIDEWNLYLFINEYWMINYNE